MGVMGVMQVIGIFAHGSTQCEETHLEDRSLMVMENDPLHLFTDRVRGILGINYTFK